MQRHSLIAMLHAPFASLALAALTIQQPPGLPPEVVPPSPYDESVEFELSSDDEQLPERGPARWIEFEVNFSGRLNIWAESDGRLDLALRVEGDNLDRPREDEDSGGGTTPFLQLSVEPGMVVFVAVAAQDPGGAREPCDVRLQLIASPETEATIRAAQTAADGRVGATELRKQGRLDESRALLAATLDELRSLQAGQWSQRVADMMWTLGQEAYDAGDYSTSLFAWGWARAHLERTLPENHRNLFVSRSELAGTMHLTGDNERSFALYTRTLETLAEIRPEDHADLLATRLNLAATMRDVGDPERARALLEEVLGGYRRTQSDDHPGLLMARQNLGVVMKDQGDLRQAHAHFEAVLMARERTLPEDHQDLLVARMNLATTLQQLGDLEGTRALEEAAVAGLARTLPKQHPYLLAVRVNLAGTMHEMGDLEGARRTLEAVIATFEKTALPDDHQGLLTARLCLVSTLMVMDDLPAARALCQGVVEVYERSRPEGHTDLLMARQIFATTLFEPSDLALKRDLCEGVLEAMERSWPEDHPDLLLARENLAATMWEMGDREQARALQESVLESKQRTLPEDHFRLLLARESLAIMSAQMGDLDGARAHLAELVAGMRLRAVSSATLSPRESREVIGAGSVQVDRGLFLSELGQSAERQSMFELIETRRIASVEGLRLDAATLTDPRMAELRVSARQASEELNAIVLRGAGEGLEGEVFDGAVRERDHALRELRTALGERGMRVGELDLPQLAAALPEASAAVGFLRYIRLETDEEEQNLGSRGAHLLAHVARPDGSLLRVELGDAAGLLALIEAWRPAMHSKATRGVAVADALAPGAELGRGAGEALRRRLLDPILTAAGEGVRTLFVCPDELVYLVPLDALPLGEAFVGDQLTVRVLSSFNDLLATPSAPAVEPQLLVLGGAAYDAAGTEPDGARSAERSSRGNALPASFSPLPQAAVEARSVAALFERSLQGEVVLLEGESATKQALVAAIAGRRYVHLATHGWFAPETVRSLLDGAPGPASAGPAARLGAEQRVLGFAPLALCGLALAGANLGPDAHGRRTGILTAEQLARLPLGDCELAVLSACETNVGPQRAGQGLQSLQTALHAAGVRWAITTLWKVDDEWSRRLMEHFYSYLWLEHLRVPDALWRAKQELIAAGAPARAWAPWVLSGAAR